MNKTLMLLMCSLGGFASASSVEEKLSNAIWDNNIPRVRALLQSKDDAEISPDEVRLVRSKEMAKFLISHNLTEACMRACCIEAIKCDWYEVVHDLIENRGLTFTKKRGRRTLAIIAAQYNRCALMKYFASKDKDIPARPIRGNYTPLHEAAKRGNLAMVKVLVDECNVPLNPLFVIKRKRYCALGEGHGRTPLHSAAENGHGDVVRYLLEKGAQVDIQDGNAETPRMLAKKKKCSTVVKIFDKHDQMLEHGYSDDEEENSSHCPNRGSSVGSDSCVLPKNDSAGETCRAVTTESDDDILAFFDFSSLESSSSSHSPASSPTGSSITSSVRSETDIDFFLNVCSDTIPLHVRQRAVPELAYKRQKSLQATQTEVQIDKKVREAVISGNSTQLSMLLNHFPQMIASRNSTDVGLLHLAAAHGHHMIFLFLVGLGLPVTDISPDKSTLLHWAAIGGNSVIISFLLSLGLSPYAKTITGHTPYELAQVNNHAEAARLLRAHADTIQNFIVESHR